MTKAGDDEKWRQFMIKWKSDAAAEVRLEAARKVAKAVESPELASVVEKMEAELKRRYVLQAESIELSFARLEEPPKIALPPGHHALSVLKVLFSRKAFDQVFAQTVLDFREEHAQALADGRLGLARWRHIQMVITLCVTVVAYLGVKLVKRFEWLWKLGG